MVESDLRASSGPDTPAGYREGYEPVRARSWLEYLPGEVGLFIGTTGLFGGLTTLVRDGTAVLGVFWNVLRLESVGVYLLLLATVGATLVAHEALHGLAGHFSGCAVSFQREGMGVGTRLRGGFLTRRAEALVTLAPLVMLTVVGVPLLVMVESAVAAAVVLTLLVTNAAGVGSDLADVLALRELPPGTLLYYAEEGQFAYEPTTAG
ncbi:DUF3267 domain-containing protein [Halococcus sp. AFM35]|uniref:DUF3267 domain-containing protein n=1 Tax=Halococcus sp. AFM35 TaxID=3421653 RepID=UPI003EB7BE98